MFLIASTGRSGTVALTEGLNACSDTTVGHEPDPLLREAWLKHRRRPYWTRAYRRRMAFYADQHASGSRYGESFRAATGCTARAQGMSMAMASSWSAAGTALLT